MESIPPTNQPTRPPVWQLVVRKPCDAIGFPEFVLWLSSNVLNYLVGEHPADFETSSTHCHILIEGLKVTDEGLRKSLKRCDISGSDYSLMKKTTKSVNGVRMAYDRDALAIYIIKGDINQVKATSFSPDQIAIWADKWVNHDAPVEAAIASAIDKPKKKPNTTYQDCDEIIDMIPDWNQRNPNIVERTQVVKAIITWANQKRKALHSVQVMNYYDVIMCNAVPEYYKALCVDLINRRHK